MTADRTYVDPSALRRLYVHDPLSRRFCAWRRRVNGSLPVTPHGRAEVINSIGLAVFRRDITHEAGAEAWMDLDADFSDGRLHLADVPWRRALDLAADLSREHTSALGTRTLDVLHIASALVLRAALFVTYDQRQAALATQVKLRVVHP